MDKVIAFLAKLGTILVDRRAIITGLFVALLSFGSMFGLTPEQVAEMEAALGETYTAIIAAVGILGQLLAAGFAVYKLIDSWTQRPPSGLSYKESEAAHRMYGPKG